MCRQVCAVWEVALNDGVYKIEFEHGTTTGKRVITVNGKEVVRRDWMFKLVGAELFSVGGAKACVRIEAVGGFSYEYSLLVNGTSLQRFVQNRTKTSTTWTICVDQHDYRIVLDKETMDVWCNGQKMDTVGEFVEDGTETVFTIGGSGKPGKPGEPGEPGEHEVCIKAFSEGDRRGVRHCLLLDGTKIPAS